MRDYLRGFVRRWKWKRLQKEYGADVIVVWFYEPAKTWLTESSNKPSRTMQVRKELTEDPW